MDDRTKALAEFLEISPDEISEGYDELNFETPDGEYMVLTDDEADEKWDEDLENYIDEVILAELPDAYRSYFDNEAWKRDARMDGRGHSLGRYDGEENEIKINDTYYYIYRTN